MKKSIFRVISTLLLLITCGIICACMEEQDPPQEAVYYTVTYQSDVGGTVSGKSEQKIEGGKSTETVMAVANTGYRFVKWSDGVETAERQEKDVADNMTVTAIFEKETFSIKYTADENGTINGSASQTVKYQENGTAVTAIPNEGFRFVKWSDGVETAERQEKDVTNNISVTAIFGQKIINEYYYNMADCYPVRKILLEYGALDEASFYIPQREHYRFNGWYLGETKVTDETGKLVIGNELFEIEERKLHAEWIADAKYTYKILIVYVTELSGTFTFNDNSGAIDINYKMTDIERQMCHMTTKQIKRYLDWSLDYLVDFQVDEYFTTIPLTRADMETNSGGYGLFADKLPEISGMLEEYQHIALSFSFFNIDTVERDAVRYTHLLCERFAFATVKYSCLFRDWMMFSLFASDITPGFYLDEANWDLYLRSFETKIMVGYVIDVYIHEFSHSFGSWIGAYPLHSALSVIEKQLSETEDAFCLEIKALKIYLLNLAEVNGERIGIPYEYWKGDVAVVQYITSDGGSLEGDGRQGVILNHNSRTVTVSAFPGYRFIGWSDGITTPTRYETNVQGDITVTALFEPIDYEVRYEAGEGGYIEGESVQYYQIYVSSGTMVVAIANEGYRFVGWSDGFEQDARRYFIDASNVELFDENNRLVLTAIFEKIE